jgi:hypothetical protein
MTNVNKGTQMEQGISQLIKTSEDGWLLGWTMQGSGHFTQESMFFLVFFLLRDFTHQLVFQNDSLLVERRIVLNVHVLYEFWEATLKRETWASLLVVCFKKEIFPR